MQLEANYYGFIIRTSDPHSVVCAVERIFLAKKRVLIDTIIINLQLIIYTWHFCSRIQVADPEYKKAFDDELVAFKKRIRKRAEEKIAEYEREERLGPGGLDPLEVMESLPKVYVMWIYTGHFCRISEQSQCDL